MESIGLENMLIEGVLGLVVEMWWLILLVVGIALISASISGKRSSQRQSSGLRNRVRRVDNTIAGKAFVTDGDGIRVAGREVRIYGIDAPEWDQLAKHSNGQWFNHGRVVKSALIREIGGKRVRVQAEGVDRFGRLLGTVTCHGTDIGEWMVSQGHAIAAYSERYKQVEQAARRAQRGMWANEHNFDPRRHRHR